MTDKYDLIVYYQVFSPDGAVESKQSFIEDDPYTGRVVASRITPPHTVKCVKRFLCKQEDITDFDNTDLFVTLTSDSGLSDQTRLRILTMDGPGSAEDDPMALIINDLRPPESSDANATIPLPSPVPHSQTSSIPSFANARVFGRHKNYVYAVAFSPDGTKVVSSSYDKTICIRNSTSGQLLTSHPIETNSTVYSVVFSPNGEQIASGCYRHPYIRTWDARSGIPICHQFEGHTNFVLSVAFSPDGRHIASGSYDMTIRIWDARLGNMLVGPMTGHTGLIRSVAYSPDGVHIASGSQDSTVRIWNTRTGDFIAGPFQGHSNYVYSVCFSPQGRWVVSGSHDYDVRVWDTEAHAAEVESTFQGASRRFSGHSSYVHSVAFSPDGQWIASGSYDKTVHVWSFNTGQTVATLVPNGIQQGGADSFWSVAISPGGDRIVAGTYGGSIYMWSRL